MTSICANCLHGLADRAEAMRDALQWVVDAGYPFDIVVAALRGKEEAGDES